MMVYEIVNKAKEISEYIFSGKDIPQEYLSIVSNSEIEYWKLCASAKTRSKQELISLIIENILNNEN